MTLKLQSSAVTAAALAALLVYVPAASAQQQSQGKPAGQQTQSAMPSQYQQVRGEITEIKPVKIRGANAQDTLVLLKTKDGQKRVVDLGHNLQGANLQKGQQLAARGRVVTVGGEKVILLADSFRYANKTYDAQRLAFRRNNKS